MKANTFAEQCGIGCRLVLLGFCLIFFLSGGCGAPRDYRGISFDVSPDGSLLVFNAVGKGTRDLYLLNFQTGEVKCLMETEACEMEPRFSPDGKWIVYAARSPGKDEKAPWHLYLLKVSDLSVQQLTDGRFADSEPIFTPDGRHIVFLRASRLRQRPFGDWDWYDPRVHLLDLETRVVQSTKLITLRSTNFSPEGKFLFIQAHLVGDTSGSEDFFLSDISALKAGKVVQQKSQPALIRRLAGLGATGEVQFLADGKQVVFIGNNPADPRFVNEIWLGDLHTGKAQPLTNIRSLLYYVRVVQKGQQAYFLRITDPVSFRPELWRVDLRTRKMERVADSSLFDNPLRWRRTQP